MSSNVLITWTNSYSVRNETIDNQHKKLVGMINELYDAFINGKANEVISEILKRMVEYTDYHFATEEKIFEKYNYPMFDEHKEKHEGFVKKVIDFQIGYEACDVSLSYEVMDFLRKWLIEHIMGEDKKYMKYFLENSIDNFDI